MVPVHRDAAAVTDAPPIDPEDLSSPWADRFGRLHCELCDRVSEVPEDDALAAGWAVTWDGALCPQCADACREHPQPEPDAGAHD